MPNVTILQISSNDIKFINEMQPWIDVKNIKGIRNIHSVTCQDGSHVQLWSHSKATEPVFQTWYTPTWDIVSFNQDILSMKLVKVKN